MKRLNDDGTEVGFWHALIFERDGDLNLTWLFVILMGLIGSAGFLWSIVIAPWLGLTVSPLVQIAAFSFLGSAFALVVLSAIPVNKEKIIAKSNVPGEIARGIASVGGNDSEAFSTDLQEGYERSQQTSDSESGQETDTQ